MVNIHEAASIGDLTTLEAQIKRGHNINSLHEGRNPLAFAAHSGQVEECQLLIDKGAGLSPMPGWVDTPLYAAVKAGKKDIVALLLPKCNAREDFLSLERAISLGFHEIADLMLQSGLFKYPRTETDTFPSHDEKLSDNPDTVAQWQKFVSERCDHPGALDPLHLEYAFVLGSKAGVAGLQLMEAILKEDNFNVNCQVKIGSSVMTPLTAASEHGHLEVVRFLLEQPGIDIKLCGEYNWPAFLHLLRSSRSISTLEGISLLTDLWVDPPVHQSIILNAAVPGPFGIVFENALRSSNEDIIRKVIDIVHGAAGGQLIPLLVRSHRAHDKQGLGWLLGRDVLVSSQRRSWIVICNYLEENEDPEAFELFVKVAEAYTQWEMWPRAIIMCLCSQNFLFAQQFFLPSRDKQLSQVTRESLRRYSSAAENDRLIKEWKESGYASLILWNAVLTGIWKDSHPFGKMICDPRIDPNAGSDQTESVEIDHRFINRASDARLPVAADYASNTIKQSLHCYQIQVAYLEQLNRKRRLLVGEPETPGEGEIGRLSQSPSKSILTWAAEIGDLSLVDVLMSSPLINVNIQDGYGNTSLIYAVARGDQHVVAKLLTKKDILLNTTDKQGRSALFYAAQSGRLDIVDLLIKTKKVYVSIRDKEGRTAIQYAKEEGHDEIVRMLQAPGLN